MCVWVTVKVTCVRVTKVKNKTRWPCLCVFVWPVDWRLFRCLTFLQFFTLAPPLLVLDLFPWLLLSLCMVSRVCSLVSSSLFLTCSLGISTFSVLVQVCAQIPYHTLRYAEMFCDLESDYKSLEVACKFVCWSILNIVWLWNW